MNGTTTTTGHNHNPNPPSPSPTKSFLSPVSKQIFPKPPRILIIGAGSRGTAYAEAALSSTNSLVAAIAEPLAYKRHDFGRKFIWGPSSSPSPGQAFASWRDWVAYEVSRRERAKAGVEEGVEEGVDAVFVCVLDEMHEEVVCGIAGLGVHVCVEKPLATSLRACVAMFKALKGEGEGRGGGRRETIFGMCHVLRYSPHNMLLRHLVREQEVVGDVLSVEHVEPVGWWHFSHSYVRGNWRKESTTAPSLLTKSCHDIDWLLWMLCSPANDADTEPHLPSHITSTGSRKFFRKERKPKAAGDATNCLSCAHEQDCKYSAKKIYLDKHLKEGITDWPVKIVNPEIEDCYNTQGLEAASNKLLDNLREDWPADMPTEEVEKRPWFGRCVWEADNDVCDDQCVTITWDDDPLASDDDGKPILRHRGAKTAQFHMIAFTEKQCERRGRIYGADGEIEYDSKTIRVHDFSTGRTQVHKPYQAGGGHGGGDEGLARQFLMAVNAADSQEMPTARAQRKYLGCDLEEAFLSHAMVFAAEDARTRRKVIDWRQWWNDAVEPNLHQR
ncbi:streptomycin biosynthesis protein StrI [Aaosphaeria arxii CBS 175.79]|uniref:Streptomycin biosynthesis protein StrI n=1 Tax=Aaosphaeria arxii CBS 175.79 TaxID=1450172 RepID=A0A6A5XTB0_9PLEO|nr:streptomycin biosynthesis protein StrI [Aaosphaeria arxii CBS 175.79]KAF2016166.1 streptomycin biosynthesis protein StrI [Aaosphaeria arxii CBS 175.79]